MLYQSLKKGDVAFVIFYGTCISVELCSIVLAKFFKIGIYKEESEHPTVRFRGGNKLFVSLQKWFYINKIYKYYLRYKIAK